MATKNNNSWANINDPGKFIARKTVDYSMFTAGSFIPIETRDGFLNHLDRKVKKGSKVDLVIIYNDIEYKAYISDMKQRTELALKLIIPKDLQDILKKELSTSWNYIEKFKIENGQTPKQIPGRYSEYIDFYIGDKENSFTIDLITKTNPDYDEDVEEVSSESICENTNELDSKSTLENDMLDNYKVEEAVEHIYDYILSKGFNYKEELIKNLYLSLKTKPFVILSGISGTGKSKIIELFAEAIGANNINGRFKLLPVKPDWADSTDLLGYRNIEGKFNPGSITSFAYEAMKHPNLPYFLCLDEMNLARVEYYFSDVLSLMETRKINEDGDIITNMLLSKEQIGRDEASFNKYGDVYLPQNLYIVGTVNMDETTFPFSKKVLDRANTIEFNEVELAFDFDNDVKADVPSKTYDNNLLKTEYLKLASCSEHKVIATEVIEKLTQINKILTPFNQHFGYRVRDEIVFYMIYATRENIMSFDVAWDFCISQKILPKISGSSNDVLEILLELYKHFNDITDKYNEFITDGELKSMEGKAKDNEYVITNKKLSFMIRRYLRDGFTTYWQ